MKKKSKIEPVVSIIDSENEKAELEYWLKKTTEERIDAVLYLREQYISSLGYKFPPSIEAVVKIISPNNDA